MNKNLRRKSLKALAISGPVVWAKPAIDSIMLPAHGETTITCPAGCYSLDNSSYEIISPAHGVINNAISHSDDPGCNSQSPSGGAIVVIAMDLDDANALLFEETGDQCSLDVEAYTSESSPCMVWEFGCGSM